MTLLTLSATDLHVAGGNAAARAYARLLRDGFPKPPAPVTADAKRAVLATLPAEGEAELDATTKAKLEVLQPVLTEYGRTAVTEIKVVHLPYACMALYGRVVLIIAGHTLRALTAEELQAVAAHELGHEYYWAEYYTAREGNDIEAMRETELLADAIAIRALLRLGKNPNSLISAVRRMNRYNAKLGLQGADMSSYPPVHERGRFHDTVTHAFGQQVRCSRLHQVVRNFRADGAYGIKPPLSRPDYLNNSVY